MIRTMRFVFVALVFCVLVACASTAPKPTESEWLRTSVASFEISRDTRAARYRLELDVLREVKAPMHIDVTYENPVSPSEPLSGVSNLSPGQGRLSLRSEPLPGIKDGATYSVTILGKRSDGIEVLRHVQPIKFILPPEL